ncbi:AIPR family protein [Vibrio fluvialis]|uniref:AIPR family protein n=1 Tax=Vibrio fluvialis TaxID=676 RepID=UPI003757742E
MAFVIDLMPEDNAIPAGATAGIMAQRLAKALKERFEKHIHKRECDPKQADYSVKMSSRAIAAFTLCHLGQVEDADAGKGVCDSSKDGGIDGIVINKSNRTVVVVQSKFNQNGNATWTNADFLTFKKACENLLQQNYERFDDILVSQSDSIDSALNSLDYKFLFVMAHTGKRGAAGTILEDMQAWQSELNDSMIVDPDTPKHEFPFQIHLVSAEDIVKWMDLQSSTSIDLNDVVLEHYGKVDTPYLAYYGTVSGDQIYEWWNNHTTKLFTKNIRNLLGKTEVNESIRDTALHSPSNFWFYNNGVTVLVRDIDPFRTNSDSNRGQGIFKFSDISVINGAQTVSNIGQIGRELGERLNELKVHVRFIKLPAGSSDDVAKEITRANNHQNRVLGRDFASQHPTQLRLREELVVENYTYQLLRTDSSNTLRGKKTIDIDEALDALACFNGAPSIVAQLKQGRGKFFENLEGTFYKSVFNSSVSGLKLINTVKHNKAIEKIIKERLDKTNYQVERKRYGILTHANRVFSTYLLSRVPGLNGATNIMNVDKESLEKNFEYALELIESLVETHFSSAYPARFFSNVEKIGLTLKCLENGNIELN